MKFYKKLLAALVAAAMLVTVFSGFAFADSGEKALPEPPDGYDGYIVFSVEAFTLGWGYIVEPVLVPFADGESFATVSARFFAENQIEYDAGSNPEESFYLNKLACENLVNGVAPNVPAYLMTVLEENYAWDAEEGWMSPENGDGMLGGYDYTYYSGWMFAVNDVTPSFGANEAVLNNGDVCRWMYTLYGYGMDIGMSDGFGMFAPFENPAMGVQRSEAHSLYAEIMADDALSALVAEGGAAHDAFYEFSLAISYLGSTQAEIDAALEALLTALGISGSVIPGDVNGDEAITVIDAVTVLRIAMQIIDAEGNTLLAADYDGDGEVTVTDAMLVLRCALGLSD